jgi:energy-coupling factor transporter transmembrane protein EcfT
MKNRKILLIFMGIILLSTVTAAFISFFYYHFVWTSIIFAWISGGLLNWMNDIVKNGEETNESE